LALQAEQGEDGVKWLLPLFIVIAVLILITVLIVMLKKPRVKSVQPTPQIVVHSTPITTHSNNTTMTIPLKLREETISSTKTVGRNNAHDVTNDD
jgi:hypothetical protein